MWSNCPWCKKSGAFPLLARRDCVVWSMRALFLQFFQPWNSSSWLTAVTFSVQPALSSSSLCSQINTEHLLCIPWKKSTAPKYLECWAGCLGGRKVLFFSVKAHSGLKTLVCFWLYIEFPAGKCLSRDAFLHSSWQSLISMGTDPGICGFACWSAAAVAEHPKGNGGNRRPEPSSLLWYPEGVVPAVPAWIQPGQGQGVGSWLLESQDKGPYTAPHCPVCLNRLSAQTRVCLCWWSCCQALPFLFFMFFLKFG